jgi:hypothetical protein
MKKPSPWPQHPASSPPSLLHVLYLLLSLPSSLSSYSLQVVSFSPLPPPPPCFPPLLHSWYFQLGFCSLLLLFKLSSCTNLVTIIWDRTHHHREEKEERSKSPSSCKQINLRNASIVEKVWDIWETLYNHILSSLNLPKRKYASSFQKK